LAYVHPNESPPSPPTYEARSINGPAFNNNGGTVILGDQQPKIAIPVISGNYALCTSASEDNVSKYWLDFLYDVYKNKGKLVFLNVEVYLLCGAAGQPSFQFPRSVTDGTVTYRFGYESLPRRAVDSFLGPDRKHSDETANYMIADNGTNLRINPDTTGRNSLSVLKLNGEGLEDVIYGPYVVKESGDDGEVTLDLYPPTLDAAEQAQVSQIDASLKQRH
jgi:hypothetical protein